MTADHSAQSAQRTQGAHSSRGATGATNASSVEQVTAEALAQLEAASDLETVAALEHKLLSRRGWFAEAKSRIGDLDPADRAAEGRSLNDARSSLEAAITAARARFSASLSDDLYAAERLDLTERLPRSVTLSRGRIHPVTAARYRLEDVFVGMGYSVEEGPEVESAWYNFEALNIPEWHPARGSFDTIFVNLGEPEEVMLRSHTSPVQIRTMENRQPPIYMVAPGRTFRTDTADATHLPAFNQIEGLAIDRNITLGDLAGTIKTFVGALFGRDVKTRLRPSYFPFTEPSAEFDISRPDGSWLELGGCGMVHPNVLRNCGIDPEIWQGFAFGFGIDRLAVMRYEIDDIREFVNNDIRFLSQF